MAQQGFNLISISANQEDKELGIGNVRVVICTLVCIVGGLTYWRNLQLMQERRQEIEKSE